MNPSLQCLNHDITYYIYLYSLVDVKSQNVRPRWESHLITSLIKSNLTIYKLYSLYICNFG